MQVWGEVFGFAQRFVAFEECSPVRPPRPSRASARGTPLLHTPPRRTHHTHPRGCTCSIDASPSKPSQMHRKVFEDPRPLPGARLLPNTSSSSSTTTQAPAAVPPFAAPPAESALDHLDQMLAQELISAAAKQAVQTGAMPKAVLPVGGAAGVGTSASASAMPSAAEMIDTSRRRTAARLDQLERLLKTQEAELRKRDREIQRQHDELRALRQENRDMHRFLADYGLQWVGGGATSRVARAPALPPRRPPPCGRRRPPRAVATAATRPGRSSRPCLPRAPGDAGQRRQRRPRRMLRAAAVLTPPPPPPPLSPAPLAATSPHTKAAGGPPEMGVCGAPWTS